jgi:ankyrin repeat protein
MKKLIIVLPLVILLSYILYATYVFSSGTNQILSIAMGKGKYPLIPSEFAVGYLKYGKKPELYDSLYGNTAYTFLLGMYDDKSDLENLSVVFDILKEKGLDVNAYSEITGMTPLHEAILIGDIDLIKFILWEMPSEPHLKIKSNNTEINSLNAYDFSEYLALKNKKYVDVYTFINGGTYNDDVIRNNF